MSYGLILQEPCISTLLPTPKLLYAMGHPHIASTPANTIPAPIGARHPQVLAQTWLWPTSRTWIPFRHHPIAYLDLTKQNICAILASSSWEQVANDLAAGRYSRLRRQAYPTAPQRFMNGAGRSCREHPVPMPDEKTRKTSTGAPLRRSPAFRDGLRHDLGSSRCPSSMILPTGVRHTSHPRRG
jgi:hypothetical protein